MQRLILVIILCFFLLPELAAQNLQQTLSFQYGNFASHKKRRFATNSPQVGLFYELSKPTTGKKYWQYAHGYPTMGLQLGLRSFGNFEVYGSAISLIPSLSFNLKKWNNAQLFIKHGTGLAFFSKRYDVNNNPLNIIIGTRLNTTSMIQIGYTRQLTPDLQLSAGGLVQHYSNGQLIQPNAGVNIAALYTSITFGTNTDTSLRKTYESYKLKQRFHYRVGYSLGLFDFDRATKLFDYNNQVQGMVYYQYNSRFRSGLGLELSNLGSNYRKVTSAIYSEQEVQFSQMVTRYGFGIYLSNEHYSPESFYSRIGIAYYLKSGQIIPKGFYIGSALKAHGFRAAHIEGSMGYMF